MFFRSCYSIWIILGPGQHYLKIMMFFCNLTVFITSLFKKFVRTLAGGEGDNELSRLDSVFVIINVVRKFVICY